MTQPEDTIPYGFCHCGCGQRTTIARWNCTPHGYVKGEPKRFLRGHAAKAKFGGAGPEWHLEDRGFDTPCWIWARGISGNGYGNAYENRKPRGAHRMIYERLRGPIPDGLHVDHLCRQRACVNPDHMELVPNIINTQRGARAALTPEIVRELRRLAAELGNQREAARRLGVGYSAAFGAIARITWRNVE